jgi:hypothetical protein
MFRTMILCLVAVLLGCSGEAQDAPDDWHCFDFKGDFGCVCEPGEPAFEPTGPVCSAAGCCFAYQVFDDTGDPTPTCRCLDVAAKECEAVVEPYREHHEAAIKESCP